MNVIPDAFDHVKQRKKLKATSLPIAVPSSFQRQSETDMYTMQTTVRKSCFIARKKNIPLCVCNACDDCVHVSRKCQIHAALLCCRLIVEIISNKFCDF